MLSIFVLFILYGCKASDAGEALPLPDEPDVESTPRDSMEVGAGAPECHGHSFTIEYFDKEKKGYSMLEREELIAFQSNETTIEYLSYVDELTGESFLEPRETQQGKYHFSAGFVELLRGPKRSLYVFKYKVPELKGDAVEEIRFTYQHDYCGSRYLKVWYNGIEIPIDNWLDIYMLYTNECGFDRALFERVMSETYYCGDLFAVKRENTIDIIIPY